MERPFLITLAKIQLIAMIAIFLPACGVVNQPSPSTSCSATTAVVQVYSGSIRRVCGCQEASNVTFSGNAFTCTVARGTTVIFYYPGISMSHQISITGAASGALQNHSQTETNPSDSYNLGSTGVYNFYDVYQSGQVFGSFTSQ